MAGKIAYVPSRFPKISETFVLREMIALQEKGMDIELFPLILEDSVVVHEDAKPWLEKLYYYPWLSLDVLKENVGMFFKRPLRYLKTWGQMVVGNLSNWRFLLRALLIFPKAVRMSVEMQRIGVEHVHAHFATHPALAAWVIHQLTDIPYSMTIHAHDLYVSQTMLKTKARDAAFLITISEFNRRFLLERIDASLAEKIHVIHCGITVDKYIQQPLKRFDASIFSIKSIGSLEPYKGTAYLIRACALLKERGIPIHCEIIGGGFLQETLQALIEELDAEDVVSLAGARTQTQVAASLAEGHCYVQPSIITETGKMEGIPVAIMEAMGSGLPVIASNISGISELVQQGKTGYLLPEKDSHALADAIEHVFSEQDEAIGFAEVGRALVIEEYDIEANATQVATLFEEELSN